MLRPGPDSEASAPDFTGSEPVFSSRKARRAYEDALAQASGTPAEADPQGGYPASVPAPYTSGGYTGPAAPTSAPRPPAASAPYTPASAPAPYTPASAPAPYTPAAGSAPYTPAAASARYTPASASAPYTPAAGLQAPSVAAPRPPVQNADPFAQLLGLAEPASEASRRGTVDVRDTDARLDDPRRSPDAGRAHRVDEVVVATHTGRLRLRPEEFARSTDSAPIPLALPGAQYAQFADQGRGGAVGPNPFETDPFGSDEVGGGIFGGAAFVEHELGGAAAGAASGRLTGKVPKAEKRAAAKAAKLAAAEAKRAGTSRPESKPSKRPGADDAGSYADVAGPSAAAGRAGRSPSRGAVSATTHPRPKAKTVRVHGARLRAASMSAMSRKRRSPLTRFLAKAGIMLAAAGMVATTAVPAYAQFDSPTWIDPSTGRTQTLAVGAIQDGSIVKDEFGAHTLPATLDSTTGSVVAPEVQALAQQLMTAVAQGRLTGSTPDHIFEIRYLAAGEAVQGCGIDYRVLQTIAVALSTFNTVGVSDINRHCTGQIEGAGTASAHYTDGGGHAVDFFRLNGHSLTGGDSDSIKLLETLDKVAPSKSTVGQVGCRSSVSLIHFQQIDDTCNHLHIDFLDATGTSLLG
ncbi:hypothetical protein [Planctomonas sp. JC2975]|uniref:hypothetical protein n=1 Tax=Planctomonas sp. JC2975 TaxID=2729626 RepID=UPI00197BE752|nr:hypothetical protein [Planctomonas sp. JC2975]